jgi:predicted TIM-barrel fold metal-dependent hydrolase
MAGATSRPDRRLLVDVHVHAGAPPGAEAMANEIHSPKDWALQRSKDPKRFAEVVSQEQVDNSDLLIKTMDEHGVTHAIIQLTPGNDAKNERTAEMARRHPGRLFPIYRPDFLMAALGSGELTKKPDKTVLASNARRIADDIETVVPELGLIGVGEVVPGGMMTSAIDPVEIAQDMGPVMEALRPRRLPIQIPTGWSGWQGGLHYIWNPIWVDEVAGIFPDVPIILTKMGRGFRTSFETCVIVAMRNANVYFDMTESPSDHVREAAERLGPQRIMFGTDLSAISVNYAHEHGLRLLDGADLSAEESDWISWRTANQVYQLGLT